MGLKFTLQKHNLLQSISNRKNHQVKLDVDDKHKIMYVFSSRTEALQQAKKHIFQHKIIPMTLQIKPQVNFCSVSPSSRDLWTRILFSTLYHPLRAPYSYAK